MPVHCNTELQVQSQGAEAVGKQPRWQGSLTCWKKGRAMHMTRWGRSSLFIMVFHWLSPAAFSLRCAKTMVPYSASTSAVPRMASSTARPCRQPRGRRLSPLGGTGRERAARADGRRLAHPLEVAALDQAVGRLGEQQAAHQEDEARHGGQPEGEPPAPHMYLRRPDVDGLGAEDADHHAQLEEQGQRAAQLQQAAHVGCRGGCEDCADCALPPGREGIRAGGPSRQSRWWRLGLRRNARSACGGMAKQSSSQVNR